MHNPLKWAKAAWRATHAVRDPTLLTDILELAPVLVPPESLQALARNLQRHPAVARAFCERPRVGHLDLTWLGALPPGTLGRSYSEHLRVNGLDPAALPRMEAPTDALYVRAHLLETHDVWHVLTGFSADVAGELGVQAFSLAQIGSPFALAVLTGGLANTLLYAFAERDARLRALVRGWLLGQRAQPLFGAAWGQLWEVSVTELRARYAIDVEAVDRLLSKPN
ncbi:Coq4 family protein [Citreicoccus inhibens]|uniref:Coq4 family protein n=1 Tax=Citreicoccus inhibens TaxID=2849499 RepID=UPI001EF0DA8D|nr:Coq4 family protein [Citreicoccus inhibens]